MLQALINKGKVIAQKVPNPVVSKGCVLIKVHHSCISAGTEMSSVKSSDASIVDRIIKNPEYIKKGINYLKEEGVKKLIEKVKGSSTIGSPTGYSVSGTVVEIGEGVTNFVVGEKVAAAGAGIANHSEFVDVPVNLVMRVPQNLDLKLASTVTLGGIAMQGVRRSNVTFGEFVVVVGAGILGLITIQLLKLSGVRVISIDLDDNRLNLAKEYGSELVINPNHQNSIEFIENYTSGFGADAVIFTAATNSSSALSDSFKMLKKKGRLILVGVVGMDIKREDIYVKELDFQISTSYGPGRYDRNYEEKGLDYPYSYVRWTENRNMSEYLRLLSTNQVNIAKMINASFPIEKVGDAYDFLRSSTPRPLMVLLEYKHREQDEKLIFVNTVARIKNDKIKVAIVGTGSFATGMHLPNLKKLNNKFEIHAICSRTPSKAQSVALQYNAKYSTANIDEILNDVEVDLIMICTRHDSHAELVIKSLLSGKNVFVEKPLAISQTELNKIKFFYEENNSNAPSLFVGYNRRFSKYLKEIESVSNNRIGPLFINYRMNAGYAPNDSWIHDDGGRIIGEACHVIDVMNFLTKSKIASISCESFSDIDSKYSSKDNKSFILKYEDGSVCTIGYFSCGNKSVSKELLEVHFDGNSLIMDDYKSLKSYGVKINEISTVNSQKGQLEELEDIYEYLSGKTNRLPIELEDLFQTTEISFLLS
jgi:predicted dehydrogenase/threonine dehydrogenase-like Zn-dependent dehydrogenase